MSEDEETQVYLIHPQSLFLGEIYEESFSNLIFSNISKREYIIEMLKNPRYYPWNLDTKTYTPNHNITVKELDDPGLLPFSGNIASIKLVTENQEETERITTSLNDMRNYYVNRIYFSRYNSLEVQSRKLYTPLKFTEDFPEGEVPMLVWTNMNYGRVSRETGRVFLGGKNPSNRIILYN